MRDETSLFLRYLLARCDPFRQTTCLTFTAMHPDRLSSLSVTACSTR